MPTSAVKVVYQDRQTVKAFLGEDGTRVLEKVINLIQEVSAKEGWPLERIEVSLYKDYEIAGWQYTLVTFAFNSTFTDADIYLRRFFSNLDVMRASLSANEDKIFRRLISLDVFALQES